LTRRVKRARRPNRLAEVGQEPSASSAGATLAASCAVGANVVIESDVFVGAGAAIVDGRAGRPLSIGSGARIAAGSVVTKSVGANTAVAGSPATPLRALIRDEQARRRRD
jgi:acetyltransferase-like isoleucine patch superfamily enzyme